MERKAAVIAVLGVIVIALFAVVAGSPQVTYVADPPDFEITPDTRPPLEAPTAPLSEVQDTGDREPFEMPWIVGAVIRVVVTACCIIAAVVAVVWAWRHRPHLRWRRRRRPPPFESLPDVVDAVTADAELQRRALRHGTPRNAIVECWLRLESSVDAAGFHRRSSDTSTELVERVLSESLVDRAALARLAELYREARFSDHALGEDRREAALVALDAVHEGLRRQRDESDAGDGRLVTITDRTDRA